MKLSILSIIGSIVLVSSNILIVVNGEDIVAEATENSKLACLTSISESQQCVKTCGDAYPIIDTGLTVGSSAYDAITSHSNLLMQCISKDTTSTGVSFPTLQLDECCAMTQECKDSWLESSTCLNTNILSNIKIQSANYLQCLKRESSIVDNKFCLMGEFCIAVLTGGAGQGYENDFDIGESGQKLSSMASEATTCSDMNPFLVDACNTVKGCCKQCQPLIAGVVKAVTNDLLLPVYNRVTPLLNCPDMTCATASAPPTTATTAVDAATAAVDPVVAVYPVVDPAVAVATATTTATTATTTATATSNNGRRERRQRELAETASTTTTTVIDSNDDDSVGDDDDLIVDYANECNDDLAHNIVVYNETYAVDNFFGCLTQKMGTIISKADASSSMEMGQQGVGVQEVDEKDEASSGSSFFSLFLLFGTATTSSLLSSILFL